MLRIVMTDRIRLRLKFFQAIRNIGFSKTTDLDPAEGAYLTPDIGKVADYQDHKNPDDEQYGVEARNHLS